MVKFRYYIVWYENIYLKYEFFKKYKNVIKYLKSIGWSYNKKEDTCCIKDIKWVVNILCTYFPFYKCSYSPSSFS